MTNFFERIDYIFTPLMNESNTEYSMIQIARLKSDIIQAYKDTSKCEGDYLHEILKTKHFDISDDGKISII
jgi:hypothetical protein